MKILIVRFSSIGDIVLTSPVVRCVKEQLGAEVHYLTKASFSSLVNNNPYINKVHLMNSDLNEVIQELRDEKFDLIIDLHNNIRTKILSRKLGISVIRYNKLNIKKWLFTRFKIDLLPDQHLVDRYFESLESLGVQNDGLGLDHFCENYDDLLAQNGLGKGSYHVFAIGGTYATKRLPNEQISTVIKRLKKPCVLIGGGAIDEQNAKEICSFIDTQVINLVGQLDLDQSAYIIRCADTILCHDSGMMHIAAAFLKPMMSIWGNTHPKFGMYPYLPEDHKDLSHRFEVDLSCRPCSKLGHDKCPKGHFNCMKMQNVDEIVKNCNSVQALQ